MRPVYIGIRHDNDAVVSETFNVELDAWEDEGCMGAVTGNMSVSVYMIWRCFNGE